MNGHWTSDANGHTFIGHGQTGFCPFGIFRARANGHLPLWNFSGMGIRHAGTGIKTGIFQKKILISNSQKSVLTIFTTILVFYWRKLLFIKLFVNNILSKTWLQNTSDFSFFKWNCLIYCILKCPFLPSGKWAQIYRARAIGHLPICQIIGHGHSGHWNFCKRAGKSGHGHARAHH